MKVTALKAVNELPAISVLSYLGKSSVETILSFMMLLRSIRYERFACFRLIVYIPVPLLLFYAVEVTVQLPSGTVSGLRRWSHAQKGLQVLRDLLCCSLGLLWYCSQPVLNSKVLLSRTDGCALACSRCPS